MSFSHLILLGIIAIIVIPPDKLPEVARQVARFLGEMRRMTSGVFDDLKNDIVLKPDDLLKQKQNNSIHQPSVTVPTEPTPVVETKTAEQIAAELKKSEDDYLKHIQEEPATTVAVETDPSEKKQS